MPSNYPAGRAAKSTPARLNSPKKLPRKPRKATMAKTDGAAPPYGEIDIVARRRNLVAFVEVKARASLDEAAYAVTPRQQARIIDAAQAWLMAHPEHAEFELRFDAMLIAPRRLPRHLLAAFDAST